VSETRLADVGGASLAYDDQGRGPAVVFLPGIMFHRRCWQPVIPAVVAAGFSAVTVDFRGQGESPPAADGNDYATHTRDVIALIERLGVAPVHLVGVSWGGTVTLRAALDRPDLLSSITCIATDARAPLDRATLDDAAVAALDAMSHGNLDPLFDLALRQVFSPGFLDTHPTVASNWRAELARNDIGTSLALTAALADRPDLREQLDQIRLPTLVVRGTADSEVDDQRAREIVTAIPGARFVELRDVGHEPPIEAPEELGRELLQFWLAL
jgi:pimeloyl-ACP methyl ester carboxylesterase